MNTNEFKRKELEINTNARLELARREKGGLEKMGMPSPFAELEILRIENRRLKKILRQAKLLFKDPK